MSTNPSGSGSGSGPESPIISCPSLIVPSTPEPEEAEQANQSRQKPSKVQTLLDKIDRDIEEMNQMLDDGWKTLQNAEDMRKKREEMIKAGGKEKTKRG